MDVRASLEAECDPHALFAFVDDLVAYLDRSHYKLKR